MISRAEIIPMLIWPKHIVSWMCGLISSDGSIGNYYYKPTKSHMKRVSIISTAYINWAKHIQKILREYVIGTSIHGPYKNKGTKSYPPHPTSPGQYSLHLNNYYPKGRSSGLDQYQVFRNNIEYWGLQKLLVNRKYKILCEFTKSMPLVEEAKIQLSLHARPCMIGPGSPIPLACEASD